MCIFSSLPGTFTMALIIGGFIALNGAWAILIFRKKKS